MNTYREREIRAALDKIERGLTLEAGEAYGYATCPVCFARQHHVGRCPCHKKDFHGVTSCQLCGSEYQVS